MLVRPSLEQLLPKVESRYTLAMLVAKRTRQLVDGAQPMVDSDTPNLVTLACEEIAADKIICVEGIHNPVVPLRPEIEEARRIAREQAANQATLDAFPDLMDISAKSADDEDLADKVLLDDTDIVSDEDIDTEEISEDILSEESSDSSKTEE